MQLFTNAKETRFFLTDDHVKNLHTIEVDSVADVINKNVVSIAALLRHCLVFIDDLDELVENTTAQENGNAHLPDSNHFSFDFLEELTYAEVVIEAVNAQGFFDEKEKTIRFVEYLCNAQRQPNGSIYFYTPDQSQLVILVDEHRDEIEINSEELFENVTIVKEPTQELEWLDPSDLF